MKDDRWRQVKDLLGATLALPEEERQAYLEKVTQEDSQLRREVESLMRAQEEMGSFIGDPPAWNELTSEAGARKSWEDRRVGPYRILRRLGRGGMGSVYLAEREEVFTQQVAIKLIRRDLDSEEIIRRFENERQIMAQLSHPNIARLLDGGTTESGSPYLVMEYVEGEPVDQYCDARKLPVRDRLVLFRQLCAAVHLSHQNLVVHRDLKPGNILITPESVAKLLDFGIAKILHPGLASTALGRSVSHRPMTLRYASPEQIQGRPVTTASDIYSLGVLLFELLTGHHPYLLDPRCEEEAAQRICEDEPRKPSEAVAVTTECRTADGTISVLTPEAVSQARGGDPQTLQRRLHGDLDSIVLKAMHKSPQHRYASVEQLSEDLRRHLEDFPVIARKQIWSYRAGRFVRRNRWAVAAASALVVVILAFAFTSTVLRKEAEREAKKARTLVEVLKTIFKASEPDNSKGRELTASTILERGRKKVAELEDQPEIRAELLDTLVGVHFSLGDYEGAIPLAEESLRVREDLRSRPHEKLALSHTNLGTIHFKLRNADEARRYLLEAVRVREGLGQSGIEITTALSNLAVLLASQKRFSEAEDLYERVLLIRRDELGSHHLLIATTLSNMGGMYFASGRLEQAERTMRQGLAIREEALEPESTALATSYNNLGRVLQGRGEVEEAETLYRKALRIRQQLLDEGHDDLARTKANLASVLIQRDVTEAEALLRPALKAFQEKRPGDWETASFESVLGAILTELDRFEEAERLLEESHQILLGVKGADSIYVEESRNRLRRLYETWGKPEKARTYALRPDARVPEGQAA